MTFTLKTTQQCQLQILWWLVTDIFQLAQLQMITFGNRLFLEMTKLSQLKNVDVTSPYKR